MYPTQSTIKCIRRTRLVLVRTRLAARYHIGVIIHDSQLKPPMVKREKETPGYFLLQLNNFFNGKTSQQNTGFKRNFINDKLLFCWNRSIKSQQELTKTNSNLSKRAQDILRAEWLFLGRIVTRRERLKWRQKYHAWIRKIKSFNFCIDIRIFGLWLLDGLVNHGPFWDINTKLTIFFSNEDRINNTHSSQTVSVGF